MNERKIEEEIKGHASRNTELIRILKEKGVEGEDQIDADYHFWAFSHENAVRFAKALYDNGFVLLILERVEDEEGIAWNIEARKKGHLNDIISRQNTDFLVRLSAEFESIFDGWGTLV